MTGFESGQLQKSESLGELNFSIYGKCSAICQCPRPAPRPDISNRLQGNKPSSKICKWVATANGILIIYARSLPQIASITIFQDYCGTLK